MATQSLAPDAILVRTNLTGALSAVQDDPDLALGTDTTWLEATSDRDPVELRVSFPTPSGMLTVGATQTLKVKVRKSAALGTAGTATLEMWETGTSKVVGQATTVADDVGVVLTLTFSDAVLADKKGAGVEVRIVGTPPGGSPSARRVVDIAAVEWDAVYEPWPPPDAVWPPLSIQSTGTYVTSDLGTLRDDLVRTYGWTETTPNAAEQARLDAARCSESHTVSGTVLVSPNGVRHLKAYCGAPHNEALTLWPPYRIGAKSGLA